MDRRDAEPERLGALMQGRSTAGDEDVFDSGSAVTPLEEREVRA
jgi:hypothetical protein